MEQKHPHAEAVYRIVTQEDETFCVEVTIPETSPTTVTSFASAADAEAWIESHKDRVRQSQTLRRRGSWAKRR
jgi:hypothetical protein